MLARKFAELRSDGFRVHADDLRMAKLQRLGGCAEELVEHLAARVRALRQHQRNERLQVGFVTPARPPGSS